MLLKLHARDIQPLTRSSEVPFIARVSTRSAPSLPAEVYLARGGDDVLPAGFRGYLLDAQCSAPVPDRPDAFRLGSTFDYLADGDVVRLDPGRSALACLVRKAAPSNALLVTERCDNYCVMCSQPPKVANDDHLLDEIAEVIPLMSPDTPEIGITGGEPTLAGDRFVELVASLAERLPRTAVHVLSNGRRFADAGFARRVAQVRHPDLMLGIPLYSDLPEEHDYVVQARGAFSETVRGVLNLKRARVRVEVRFVVHRDTYSSLPDFARFVARNLLFIDHVALMGLELMGFARANLDQLWIDPLDYQSELAAAVRILARAGMRVSIYNHQLCTLPPALHRYARRSISDWKNMHVEACETCGVRPACGGFFASSQLRRSRGLRAIETGGAIDG